LTHLWKENHFYKSEMVVMTAEVTETFVKMMPTECSFLRYYALLV